MNLQCLGPLVSGICVRLAFIIIAVALSVVGCSPPNSPPGFKEQNLPVSSETFKSYSALFSVDRTMMGFPPLPTNGSVQILTVDRANWKLEYPPPIYDTSFQFYEGSSAYPRIARMVALKHSEGGDKWISEQISFSGPTLFTADGQLANESITITAETEQVAVQGKLIQGTLVTYEGPDQQLAKQCRFGNSLSITQIGPILRTWGYNYEADKLHQVRSP
jgi:hypothetical protein